MGKTLVSDAAKVKALVDGMRGKRLVEERIANNVEGPAPKFTREEFWRVMLGCLLTTQQNSSPGSPVGKFMDEEPFRLPLGRFRGGEAEDGIGQILRKSSGIRMWRRISGFAAGNLEWLEGGGWTEVEAAARGLAGQRNCAPSTKQVALERACARELDAALKGFGPKQSRNLWQWLGLTRYEIPLDSRVAKWVNGNLSVRIDVPRLSFVRDYEGMLDGIQQICAGAGVLPCVFDAAAFSSFD